jgi:hypothetical protein
MRISTILITLQSLMDTAPLRHEPGFEQGRDEMSAAYAKCIEHSCIQYILSCIEKPSKLGQFEDVFKERLPAALERLEVRLIKLKDAGELQFLNLPYGLCGKTNYAQALERLVKLKATAIGGPK